MISALIISLTVLLYIAAAVWVLSFNKLAGTLLFALGVPAVVFCAVVYIVVLVAICDVTHESDIKRLAGRQKETEDGKTD